MRFVITAGLVISCVVSCVIYKGSKGIIEDGESCAARGGVQAKTYDGFACVQPLPKEPQQ